MSDPHASGTAAGMIRLLRLRPHPEGGWYRETFRSRARIPACALPRRYRGSRPCMTSILFLLPAGAVSRRHRVASDELWIWQGGGAMEIREEGARGRGRRTVVGPAGPRGRRLQHAVPGRTWFEARPAAGSPFSLVACVVAPGFEFADFELARLEDSPAQR